MNDEVKILVPAPPLPATPTAPHAPAVPVVKPPTLAEMKLKAQQSPRPPAKDDPEDGWEFIDGEGWRRKIDFPPLPEPIKREPTPEQRLRSAVLNTVWDDLAKRSGVPVKKIESFAFYRSVPKQKILDALADALGVPRVPVEKGESDTK